MFLLFPEADMRPGNLQAQVPRKMRFGLLLTKGFPANGAIPYRDYDALVAHESLGNHTETAISGSPTVSRFAKLSSSQRYLRCRAEAGFMIEEEGS
jgi:hypothetical protein